MFNFFKNKTKQKNPIPFLFKKKIKKISYFYNDFRPF